MWRVETQEGYISVDTYNEAIILQNAIIDKKKIDAKIVKS